MSCVVFLILVAALAAVSVAHGAQVYFYWVDAIDPGSWYATGHNTRLYNRVCRDGNSGKMSAKYMQNFVVLHDTGTLWTNCQQGAIARLENDGYFQARCDNDGTVRFQVVCQTTQP